MLQETMTPTCSALRSVAPGPALALTALLALLPLTASAQEYGSLTGRVVFEASGQPVHGAVILALGPGRSTTTDADGRFEIRSLLPGRYEVLAQREHLSTLRQVIEVQAGRAAQVEFRLQLQPVHEQVTVTATPGGAITTYEAFNTVQTIDAFAITQAAAPTLGHLVEQVPGVDLRTFGAASTRPIIRGFDGDRVLILQDGIRSGDLSSQSGDHGTTIDPGSLESVEVVRGPATLLYGSNAVGGLVHALTPQEGFRRSPFSGLRGQVLTDAGTVNAQAGGNANLQYGNGSWMLWAGGGSRRTGDYGTPAGTIEHSASRMSNGRLGVGFSGDRTFFSVGYDIEDGRYGVPFAGEFHAHDHDHDHDHDEEEEEEDEELFVDILPRRQNLRFDLGGRNLETRFLDSARLVVSHLRWRHDEVEIEDGIEELATRFDNHTTIVRGELEQRRIGRLTGRIGASTEFRDYRAEGEEALANPTTQRTISAFAYEELDFGTARVMFGGRFDRTAYDTEPREALHLQLQHDHGDEVHDEEIDVPATRNRQFTGGSAAVGLHLGVAPGTALVTTVTRSYRAPALEELYNLGAHVGNLAFEIGNPDLDRESTVGLDVSLRHRAPHVRGEFNTFLYRIDNFVFPDVHPDDLLDGLRLTEFRQGNSQFAGVDAGGSVRAHEHLWINASVGYVNARLTELDEYVPRIPPVHGRVSADIPWGGLTVTPELSWAARQSRVFRDEAVTDGYRLFSVTAAYVLPRPHFAHIFSVSGRNLTNELYRRHTSFIKDLAPEVGRTVTFSYGVRFF
jgi:iron complex outermembrane recepter protein